MLTPNLSELEAIGKFLAKLFEEAGIEGHALGLTLPDTLARIPQDTSYPARCWNDDPSAPW